ncbi:MAG: SpoIID/LytB domain-containing protein [Candidatus Aureabacteria bacterium]|nr:SpoIID/LytB domain-containing protein [Candidatus Auribacterota bacterium]
MKYIKTNKTLYFLFFIGLSVYLTTFFIKDIYSATLKTRISPPQFENIRILLDSGIKKNLLISYKSEHPLDVIINDELVFQIKNKKFNIRTEKEKTLLGTVEVNDDLVILKLKEKTDYFTYKGHKLFNSIMLSKNSTGKSFLVHLIPLEEYITRVLPAEMPLRASRNALKAQAITTRTYSTYNILERRIMPYDLTIEAQAFGPPREELKPVKETTGMVILLKGHIIPAFFHTNCGGFTEYSVNVWRTHYYYSHIIKCPYCSLAKHFSWKASFTFKKIEKSLQKAGYKIRDISGIYSHSVTPETHRTTKVMIRSRRRKPLIMTANTFRLLISHRDLKSTFFTIKNYNDHVEFIGKGYGHGVGMCQDGAQEMARQGKTIDEIIQFYFPETKIQKIY